MPTTSAESAGLRSVHWPGFAFDKACEPALADLDVEYVWSLYKDVVAANDAFNDLPTAFLWRCAFRDHKDAHFVIVLRSPEAWIKSIRRHTSGRKIDVMEKLQYWSIFDDRREHISDYPDDMIRDGYVRYYTTVAGEALRAGVRLATFWLEDEGIERKLKLEFGWEGSEAKFGDVDINRRFYKSD